jgi:cardiolipin synthase A/B
MLTRTKSSRKVSAKFTGQNQVQLVRGGRDYFNMLYRLIKEARETIHLQTYIFDDDETGQAVADALIEAAGRKVAVYVLIDGYASRHISREFVARIRQSGVCLRFFEPLFKSSNFYFGRRLHHKIFVADAMHSLLGGVNISNRYNDMDDEPAWLDFALYAHGQVARELCVLCSNTWRGFKTSVTIPECPTFPTRSNLSKSSLVSIRRNDWARGRNQISNSYMRMFRRASSHIIIISSYFLPGERFRRSLKRAVKRGVKVTVVVAGYSDVLIAKNAEKFIYDWLLRNNIEIYEVQDRVLHAKVASCDGRWMTIGSYNVNDISAHASIEANVDIEDPAFVQDAERLFREIIRTECQQVTATRHLQTKNIFRQFRRWLAYQSIRVLLFLFTFYFKPTRER